MLMKRRDQRVVWMVMSDYFLEDQWDVVVGIMIMTWLYGTSVVLDGNSHRWKNSDQALKMMKN